MPTVKRLLDVLEQTFVVFLLRPFWTNKVKELKKSPKVRFFDNGFRNWVIDRFEFSPEEMGRLFEGFVAVEAIKRGMRLDNMKFWRTADGSYEVDLVFENLKLAWEAKYKPEAKLKKSDFDGIEKFVEVYPDFKGEIVHLDNFAEKVREVVG